MMYQYHLDGFFILALVGLHFGILPIHLGELLFLYGLFFVIGLIIRQMLKYYYANELRVLMFLQKLIKLYTK